MCGLLSVSKSDNGDPAAWPLSSIFNLFRFSVQIKSNVSKLAKPHKFWSYNKNIIDVQTLEVQILMVLLIGEALTKRIPVINASGKVKEKAEPRTPIASGLRPTEEK